MNKYWDITLSKKGLTKTRTIGIWISVIWGLLCCGAFIYLAVFSIQVSKRYDEVAGFVHEYITSGGILGCVFSCIGGLLILIFCFKKALQFNYYIGKIGPINAIFWLILTGLLPEIIYLCCQNDKSDKIIVEVDEYRKIERKKQAKREAKQAKINECIELLLMDGYTETQAKKICKTKKF